MARLSSSLILFIILVCSAVSAGLSIVPGSVFAQAQGDFDQFLAGQGALDTDIRPDDVVKWSGLSAKAYSDGVVAVELLLTTKDEFTLYQDKVSIFSDSTGFIVEGMVPPKTKEIIDPITQDTVEVYFGGPFQVYLRGPDAFENSVFPLKIRYIACTQKICLFPFTQELEIPVYQVDVPSKQVIGDGKLVQPTQGLSEHASIDDKAAAAECEEDLEACLAKGLQSSQSSWAWLLVIALVGGLLTNLTPCVYPMIPITLRVLSGQGHSALLSSAVYATGILVTYTALGLFASLSGSLFGGFMANETVNLFFAFVMVIFGLTMLGYGNFAGIQNLASRLGSGGPSLKNTALMGVGAGFVASPCTGPILATLLTFTAKEADPVKSSILLLTYSFGFSIPYVFLGSFAAKIGMVKVSPRFQLLTKLLFSSVMFALALYYMRIPAYGMFRQLTSYWPMLFQAFLGLGILLTLGFYLKRELLTKKHLTLIPAMVLGICLFSGWQWYSLGTPNPDQKVEWVRDEQQALDLAIQKKSLVLIDVWAEWCEACKKMDKTTFRYQPIIGKLSSGNWIPLKVDVTEGDDEHLEFQDKYGIASLPTLVLLDPNASPPRQKNIVGYIKGVGLLNRLIEFEREQD